MIFFDRSVLRGVADGIAKVRDDTAWLEDVFAHHWIKDRQWLPVAGQNGWLVVLRDKHVRTRREERRAIRENNVGCFILNYKKDKNRWDTMKIVVATLDEMEEKFANTPRPFIYLIDGNGRFKYLDP